MDDQSEFLERIRRLECSLESLQSAQRAADLASQQRWRFAVVVVVHGLIATLISIFSPLLPAVFVNGWILGAYLWALVWFEASPRGVVERASRFILSSVVVLWMMREATQFFLLEISGVALLALVFAPYVMLVARWTFAIFRVSLNAPDIADRRMRPLSLLDLGTAIVLVALLCAWLRTQDSASIFQQLAYLAFAIVPAWILAMMVMGLAKANRWRVRVLIVGMTLLVLGMAAWGASTWFGDDIRELSWADIVETSPLADASIEAIRLRELSESMTFAVSLLLPSLLTMAFMRQEGYRFRA
jgi:hypothetical protein